MTSFDRQHWTLAQVVAWVWDGDRALVRELGDNAASAAVLIGESLSPYRPRPRQREAAVGEIYNEVEAGRLPIIGRKRGIGPKAKISHEQLPGMCFCFNERRYGDTLRPCRGGDHRRVNLDPQLDWWNELWFPREAVMAIWPDPFSGPSTAEDDAATAPPPRKREDQVAETRAKYVTWHVLALELKAQWVAEGRTRGKLGLAQMVANSLSDEDRRKPETVLRRLDKDYPGWAK